MIMSGKISIDILTLSGVSHNYEIDIGLTVAEIIKHIVSTHRAYVSSDKFDPKLVELNQTRLIFNGKTLDHSKTLEEYTEFQYKPKNSNTYKMHIVVKGGSISSDSFDEFDGMSNISQPPKSTSPVYIKSSSESTNSIFKVGSVESTAEAFTIDTNESTNPITIHSLNGSNIRFSNQAISRSFPGTNSFLQSQINRLDRRKRVDSLKQVSASLNEISHFLIDFSEENQECPEKLDKIMKILNGIDVKLEKLIELGTSPN